MAYLIEFTTGLFDVSLEPKNPVNPIFGHSVLEWLARKLKEKGIKPTEPDHEDWGWYFDVAAFDASYLVGAAALTDEESKAEGPIEWIIQIHKHRKLSERLLGKNKLDAGDRLCGLIETIVRSEPSFTDVNASLGR